MYLKDRLEQQTKCNVVCQKTECINWDTAFRFSSCAVDRGVSCQELKYETQIFISTGAGSGLTWKQSHLFIAAHDLVICWANTRKQWIKIVFIVTCSMLVALFSLCYYQYELRGCHSLTVLDSEGIHSRRIHAIPWGNFNVWGNSVRNNGTGVGKVT